MKITDFELFKPNSYSPFENNGKLYSINREPYLDIVLTDHCNANCSFCIADLIHDKLNLDFDKAKEKVIFAVKYMNVKEALLLGGEPTVSNILIPFIEFLKTLNLNKIIITTNGINLRNKKYREKVFSSGLTHLNISFMSLDEIEQSNVTKKNKALTFEDLMNICISAREHGIITRINNIYKGNNDDISKVAKFYFTLNRVVDSIKFSPLLKTDAFSVINIKTDWVKEHILSDKEYDDLFTEIENYYSKKHNVSVITNDELFGFVKNSMIPLDPPIILNWNQHGQMMKKVVEENKINNLKILPNNELSLSWNRELTNYYIKTCI